MQPQEPSALGSGSPGWITGRDERLRERFQQLLVAVPTRDLPAAWQLALDIGRPAAPVLWEMMQAERSEVGRRLGVLAAAVLAGGVHEDDRLFAWLDQQKPMLEERSLAGVLIALGPKRTRPMPNFWSRVLGPTKSTEQLLAIAVRLAAVRFPGTEDGAPVLSSDDPGLAAATAFAGLPVPTSIAAKWWILRDPPRHAELFWRGALLGGARVAVVPGDGLLQRATEVMALQGEVSAPARVAATLYRVRARDLKPEGQRLDARLLQAAASDLETATLLQAWFGPAPQSFDEEPHRLAVAYVLSRSPETVIAERATWTADRRISKHVAIALAWRLLGSTQTSPVGAEVPGLAEWQFVRWASGAAVDRAATSGDPALDMALQLTADGRLPRQALRLLLEETLWRWGSHPRLAPWEQERLLLRDLLLAGSQLGGGKYQPHVPSNLRYCPTGLDRSEPFFAVAVALFDFLKHPRSPMPPEHRLPG